MNGAYEFISLVGKSSESSIFLVKDRSTGEKLLFKKPRNAPLGHSDHYVYRLRRFHREMEIVSSLDHPNIARPVDVLSSDADCGIIYPFIEGTTLSQSLESNDPYSESQSVRIAIQILSALGYIHLRRIIHADVNPHNVFVSQEKGVQLLDFGLALTEDESQRQPEGIITGTPPYIAPEQTGFTNLKMDARTDLYCVGIILYRLLSGKLPFLSKTGSLADLLSATLKREFEPIRGVNHALNAVLLKALKPTPDERYQTATGFIEDLKCAESGLQGSEFIAGELDAIAAVNKSSCFVARHSEIDELHLQLKRSSQGRFCSLALLGVSGVGKTEIVRNFRNSLDHGKVDFLSVTCNRFTPYHPYSAIRHLIIEFSASLSGMSDVERESFKECLGQDLEEQSGVICKIIPEVQPLFPEVKPVWDIDPEKESGRIKHVLGEVLKRMCEFRRFVIFVDNFQWVDRTSFDVLRTFFAVKPRVLAIFAVRTEKDAEDADIFGVSIREYFAQQILNVKAFDIDEISKLVRSRFGEIKGHAELVAMLHHQTNGVPYTVAEAIRYLVNTAIIRRSGSEWTFSQKEATIPTNFDLVSLTMSKIGGLTSLQKKCLQVASLVQGGIDAEVISEVLMSTEPVQPILNSLEVQGFLAGNIRGGFRFGHDKIQEAVEQSITECDRASYMKKLGKIFERLSRSDREYIFRAAECFLKSQSLQDAIRTCRIAAGYAAERVAFEVALKYYQTALMLTQKTRPRSTDVRELQVSTGEMLMRMGRNVQAARLFRNLLESKDAPVEEKVDFYYRLGVIHCNLGEYQQSAEYLKKSLFLLGIRIPEKTARYLFSVIVHQIAYLASPFNPFRYLRKGCRRTNELRLGILCRLVTVLYYQDMAACFYALVLSMNLIRKHSTAERRSQVFQLYSVGMYEAGLKGLAFKYSNKSLEAASVLNRIDERAFSKAFRAMLHLCAAQWDEALAYANEGVSEYGAIGYSGSYTILCHEHIWRVYLNTGKLHQAMNALDSALKLCERENDFHFLLATLSGTYYVRLLASGYETEKLRKDIEDKLHSAKSFLTVTHAVLALIEADLALGNRKRAFNLCQETEPLIRKLGFNSVYNAPAVGLFCETILCELEGRTKGQTRLHGSSAQLYKWLRGKVWQLRIVSHTYPAYRGTLQRTLARHEALKGKSLAAERHFRHALSEFHRLSMRIEEGRTLRHYGDFLAAQNRLGDSRDKYNEAYRLFAVCGDKLEADRLEDKVDPWVIRECEGLVGKPHNSGTASSSKESSLMSTNQIRVDTLSEISATITKVDDIEVLLQQMIQALLNATGAQYAIVFLEGQDEYHTERCLARDFEGRTIDPGQLLFSQAIINEVRSSKDVVLRNDIRGDKDVTDTDTTSSRSVLCVPLARGDTYLGCVYLGNDIVSGLFSDESKKAALIIAAQASILLENAYLMDNYKRLNRHLSERVKEQTQDIREKNDQLQQANLRLIESERMKGILSGTLVHDIKNYATGIQASMQILGRKIPDDKRITRLVRIANDGCCDIVALASNVLDISKMDDGKLVVNKEVVTEKRILDMAEKLVHNPLFSERGIRVSLDSSSEEFQFQADPYLLNRVLQNFFNNAAKYTAEKGTVRFSVTRTVNEDIICLYSSGEPIPDKSKESIFEKYSRMSGESSQYSKGLGLFFCKMVMDGHRGRIWVDTDETGNYFKLSFPRAEDSSQTNNLQSVFHTE